MLVHDQDVGEREDAGRFGKRRSGIENGRAASAVPVAGSCSCRERSCRPIPCRCASIGSPLTSTSVCDRALSGRYAETRPEFQRMISDSAKHAFDFVLVWKLDRFSRDRYDSAIYKKKLRANGVRVRLSASATLRPSEREESSAYGARGGGIM